MTLKRSGMHVLCSEVKGVSHIVESPFEGSENPNARDNELYSLHQHFHLRVKKVASIVLIAVFPAYR